MNINDCTISDNRADQQGGGLYAVQGGMVLTNGTLFRNNTAPVGATIFIATADVVYMLPAPAGHYIMARECTVTFAYCPVCTSHPCAQGTCYGGCRKNASLEPAVSVTNCVQPPYVAQSCPWDSRLTASALPAILGRQLETLLPGTIEDAVWPMPCPRGFVGASGADIQGQASASCAGVCPAGSYCPDEATIEPLPCSAGSYCPLGTTVPLPCHGGTYSNATSLAELSQCTQCPAGSSCLAGSLAPSPCHPGTIAAASSTTCALCKSGSYQPAPNATACLPCEPGAWCGVGASAALLCDKGTYGSATNLTSPDDCTPCPEGSSCPTGSSTPVLCDAGSYATAKSTVCSRCAAGRFKDALGQAECDECPAGASCAEGATAPNVCSPGRVANASGSAACMACAGGSYQSAANATGCLPCEAGSACPESSAAPLPCIEGSYSNATDLSDVDQCTPCPLVRLCPYGCHLCCLLPEIS